MPALPERMLRRRRRLRTEGVQRRGIAAPAKQGIATVAGSAGVGRREILTMPPSEEEGGGGGVAPRQSIARRGRAAVAAAAHLFLSAVRTAACRRRRLRRPESLCLTLCWCRSTSRTEEVEQGGQAEGKRHGWCAPRPWISSPPSRYIPVLSILCYLVDGSVVVFLCDSRCRGYPWGGLESDCSAAAVGTT